MLGETIKHYRQKKGYTQEEVASRLHVSRQTISKWEKNYSVPDADLLVRLAEVFEVDTGSLLGSAAGNDAAEKRTGKDMDEYAQQLAHIAEQMAIKNRRIARIWRTIGITLAVLVVGQLIAVLFGLVPVSSYTRTGDNYTQTIEEMPQVYETETIPEE